MNLLLVLNIPDHGFDPLDLVEADEIADVLVSMLNEQRMENAAPRPGWYRPITINAIPSPQWLPTKSHRMLMDAIRLVNLANEQAAVAEQEGEN